jgi:hypothetical protein
MLKTSEASRATLIKANADNSKKRAARRREARE